MKKTHLHHEEKALLEAFEKGTLRSANNVRKGKEKYRGFAKHTLAKFQKRGIGT